MEILHPLLIIVEVFARCVSDVAISSTRRGLGPLVDYTRITSVRPNAVGRLLIGILVQGRRFCSPRIYGWR